MIRPALIAGLLLLVGACSSSYDHEDHADMNPLPLKPLCIGSLTLDVPAGQTDWQQTFDFSSVSRLSRVDTPDAFWEVVDKRKRELEESSNKSSAGQIMSYEKLGANSALIQFRRHGVHKKVSRTEKFQWVEGVGYRYDLGPALDDRMNILKNYLRQNTYSVYPTTKRAPDRHGFCIDSAVVTGKIGTISAGVAVDIKAWPGVIFSVDAVEDDGSRDPLPWQLPENKVDQSTLFQDLELRQGYDQPDQSSFEVIRRREKKVAGMPGQEIAYKAVYDNGQIYYNFQWLSTDDEKQPRNRGLGVNLSAGSDRMKMDYDYQAPPDQEDLIALWDDVLESAQVRPGMK